MFFALDAENFSRRLIYRMLLGFWVIERQFSAYDVGVGGPRSAVRSFARYVSSLLLRPYLLWRIWKQLSRLQQSIHRQDFLSPISMILHVVAIQKKVQSRDLGLDRALQLFSSGLTQYSPFNFSRASMTRALRCLTAQGFVVFSD